MYQQQDQVASFELTKIRTLAGVCVCACVCVICVCACSCMFCVCARTHVCMFVSLCVHMWMPVVYDHYSVCMHACRYMYQICVKNSTYYEQVFTC